jgi:hypothetical protein
LATRFFLLALGFNPLTMKRSQATHAVLTKTIFAYGFKSRQAVGQFFRTDADTQLRKLAEIVVVTAIKSALTQRAGRKAQLFK